MGEMRMTADPRALETLGRLRAGNDGSSETSDKDERLLGRIFEDVAKLRIPEGASHLDLGLDVDRRDGQPGIHLKLSLRAEGVTPPPATSAAFVAEPSPETVFGPRGHGAIAFVAMKDLEERRPDIKDRIDAILAKDPLQGPSRRTDYFVVANWPDRIKRERPETKPWHFVDLLYDPEQPDVTPDLPPAPNALTALEAMAKKIGRGGDAEEEVDALCFLIHIVGDIHQPFHCITRVTPDLPAPDGDRGGNGFKLSGHYKSLHSLWDDSVNLSLRDRAEELADEVREKHSRESLAREIATRDPEAWVRAGYALAVERGYRPLESIHDAKPRPSNRYLRNARDLGQRQAALGGYRLADMLIELLG
ncbi:Endonuclease [Minicystis rosea]|nr:Endonuclease [Minicystis rosea]